MNAPQIKVTFTDKELEEVSDALNQLKANNRIASIERAADQEHVNVMISSNDWIEYSVMKNVLEFMMIKFEIIENKENNA